MRHYCTYFDKNYLPRALALHESLLRHSRPFTLWVLCLDDVCHAALTKLALEGVQPISLPDFERGDDALLAAKQNRSRVEYYFTCSPTLPLRILDWRAEADAITYIDADLYFFADPQPLYDEIGARSIGIIGHRYPPRLQHLERHGIYNVGWQYFRRDEAGLACLRWWRERCLEWCYDRCEPGRFADQKYLDEWPEQFSGVSVLPQKGANLAPWNIANYEVAERGGKVTVDGEPLFFYHFHGVKPVVPGVFDPGFARYQTRLPRVVRDQVYQPYLRVLTAQANRVKSLITSSETAASIREQAAQAPVSLWWRLRERLRIQKSLLSGQLIRVPAGD